MWKWMTLAGLSLLAIGWYVCAKWTAKKRLTWKDLAWLFVLMSLPACSGDILTAQAQEPPPLDECVEDEMPTGTFYHEKYGAKILLTLTDSTYLARFKSGGMISGKLTGADPYTEFSDSICRKAALYDFRVRSYGVDLLIFEPDERCSRELYLVGAWERAEPQPTKTGVQKVSWDD